MIAGAERKPDSKKNTECNNAMKIADSIIADILNAINLVMQQVAISAMKSTPPLKYEIVFCKMAKIKIKKAGQYGL